MVGASVLALIVAGAGVAAGVVMMGHRREKAAWQQMDTREQYLVRYPFCDTPRGIQCAHCACQSLQIGGDAARRFFSCSHCGAKLYRHS